MDPAMIATTEQASNSQASDSQHHLVIFRLDRQVYGLSIDKVVQIFPMVKITPLPQLEHLIEGVINVRGKIAPVINVRRPLGLCEARLRLYTPIILVQLRGHTMGLIVDEVLDVQSFSADQMVRTSEILPNWVENAPVLDGLVYLNGLTILLINPEHLLQPVQIQAVLQSLSDGGERKGSSANLPPQPAAEVLPAVAEPAGVPQAEVIAEAAGSGSNGETPASPQTSPQASMQASSAPAAPRKSGRSRGSRKAEDRLAQQFSDLTNDLPPAEV